MKAKYKMNKFLKQEFKKTFPLYILGVVFETIAIYITLVNTQIIGRILDMILQANVSKEQIMQELYKLIFYSAIIFIPNTIKRICYFIVARASDTRIRKEIYHKLQYVKEEYYDRTEKGKLLAYLTKEIPMIRKFFSVNYRFNYDTNINCYYVSTKCRYQIINYFSSNYTYYIDFKYNAI